MKKTILLTAAAALLLTGCARPAKDAEYKNINDLGAAYESAVGNGVECRGNDDKVEKF